MGRLAIIGGGAAGLAAAVTAARELRLLGVPGDVAVYEADERVGRSILATGNGRCNFSNARIDAGAYRNAAFVEAALGALAACSEEMAGLAPEGTCGAAGPDPVHAFFAGLGLVWREEGEGRLYPLANKAPCGSTCPTVRAAASTSASPTGRWGTPTPWCSPRAGARRASCCRRASALPLRARCSGLCSLPPTW